MSELRKRIAINTLVITGVFMVVAVLDYLYGPMVEKYMKTRSIMRSFFIMGAIIYIWSIIELVNRYRLSLGEKPRDKGIFAGMPRELLAERGYTEDMQIDRFEEEGKEFVSYRYYDGTGEERVITFFLLDGEVRLWDKEDIEHMRIRVKEDKHLSKWM